MAVEITVRYLGELRCEAVHGPSGTTLVTDAPTDNHGRGESFSPTDLVATGLGSCILTILGIVADRHGWDLSGARVRVVKRMTERGRRRIERLETEVSLPGAWDAEQRRLLQRAAETCPVKSTLEPGVAMPIAWRFGEEEAES